MPMTRRGFTLGASLAAGSGILARPALADTSPIVIGYPAALRQSEQSWSRPFTGKLTGYGCAHFHRSTRPHAGLTISKWATPIDASRKPPSQYAR